MKLGQNIGFIDFMDEFENGQDRWENMAFRGWGSFLYMYSLFETGSGCQKTWPPWGYFPYILCSKRSL